MADAGKKKKTKGTTVPLSSFLSDAPASQQSWADIDDNEDDFDAEPERNEPRREYREGIPDERRRQPDNDRPRRRNDGPQKEPPTRPPFIAFVGNLSFKITEDDLGDFFAEHCTVKSVRIIVDRESGRSKGYGYVTFEDRDSLVTALEATGVDLDGRSIRVDVAEEKETPNRDFGRPARNQSGDYNHPPSRADSVDKWERGKKVPVSDKRPVRAYNPPRGDRGDRKPSSDFPSRSERPAQNKPRTNPFGDAKPRDETLFLKKQEERPKSGSQNSSDKKREEQKRKPKGPSGRKQKEDAVSVESGNLYSVLAKEES